jgi:hypothetical protein
MTTILYVGGDERSAFEFAQRYDPVVVYKEMLDQGVAHKVFEKEYEYYIEVDVREFEEVDINFINFMFDQFVDYDLSKDKNIFVVG